MSKAEECGRSNADELSASKEFSSDSHSSSRNSIIAPRYHYHGLAETQTQGADEDDEVDESSQKENLNNPNRNRDGRTPPVQAVKPVSPRALSSRNPPVEAAHADHYRVSPIKVSLQRHPH